MVERMIDAGAALAGLDPASLTAYGDRRGDDAATTAWRHRALAALTAVPFPDRVRHLWRYTDPERLLPRRLLQPSGPAPLAAALPAGPAVRLEPGREPRLNDAARSCGLVIAPLFADPADRELIGRAVPVDHGYFEAINAAAFGAGLTIRAPRGFGLAAPLRVVVAADAGADVLPRLLVIAEDGAALTVVEEHTGGGGGGCVIGVTEILIGANAEVRHVLVQRWADGQVGHLTQRARLERDARFFGATAGFGGAISKVDLGGLLAGEGARSELVGVALPEGRQHLDHHTLHQHLAARTWSHIDFKVAVAGRARSAYTGAIRIERDAPGSEAYQENRNLLLSDRARADTIPELEIHTDDVSCSHGATAAPIDPDQLFYLRSRGLSAPAARQLVVRGFVEPTLRQLPADLRAELENLVDARLARLREVG
ncbi:MAG TPA: Fe-S cluster assembly protein SufD [Candidatus Krumholzibacteria bacterium]|nr:Fe-S cluster assembly protein SufD [Candidatus Krumholzibacteria bacterium]HPD71174.1 Fe-S cluster assembly protein SufD [Candidatus Krumholzibacteria bacterium]HRY39126.1 Fe-S cluster assembly protein SufD [Candidatus Krumholzibacteria bacterium]